MLHWLTRWRYLYISSNQTLLCLLAFIYEIESEPNEETLHGWIKLALSNHGSYTNWKLKSNCSTKKSVIMKCCNHQSSQIKFCSQIVLSCEKVEFCSQIILSCERVEFCFQIVLSCERVEFCSQIVLSCENVEFCFQIVLSCEKVEFCSQIVLSCEKLNSVLRSFSPVRKLNSVLRFTCNFIHVSWLIFTLASAQYTFYLEPYNLLNDIKVTFHY